MSQQQWSIIYLLTLSISASAMVHAMGLSRNCQLSRSEGQNMGYGSFRVRVGVGEAVMDGGSC